MKNEFSEEVIEILTSQNLVDINTPDTWMAMDFQESVIEDTCHKASNIDHHSYRITPPFKYPAWLPKTHHFSEYTATRTETGINWIYNRDLGASGTGYIDFYAHLKNLSRADSAQELATQYELSKEELFGPIGSATWTSYRWHDEYSESTSFLDMYFRPFENCLANNEKYTLKTSIPIHAGNSSVSGYLWQYQSENGNDILLPGRVAKKNDHDSASPGHLRYGVSKAHRNLLNAHLLRANRSNLILLCENPLIAYQLQETSLKAGIPMIATSWYGGKRFLDQIFFSDLENRNVIYIPDLGRENFLNATNVTYCCQHNTVRSFKVLPFSISLHPIEKLTEKIAALHDPFTRQLIQATPCVMTMTANDVLSLPEKACAMSNYQHWLGEMGLKTPITTDQIRLSSASNPVLGVPRPTQTTKKLSSMIAQDYITLILGDSDAGKGFLAISLAYAISTGKSIFGFSSDRPCRVLYIDSETDERSANKKLERVVRSFDSSKANTEFFFRVLLLENPPTSCDIFDEPFQEFIADELERTGAKVLFLDNLQTMGGTPSPNNWTSLIGWIRRIEKRFKAAVVIVHHTTKEGRPRGGTSLEDTVQNIILLQGRERLREHGKSDFVNPYMDIPGCLFNLKVKKCKPYPELQVESKYYFLALNPQTEAEYHWQELNDKIDSSVRNTKSILSPSFPGLSPDEQIVMDFAFTKNDWFTRKDVESKLNSRQSKTGNILKKLFESQRLDKIGSSRATKYKIRQPSCESSLGSDDSLDDLSNMQSK